MQFPSQEIKQHLELFVCKLKFSSLKGSYLMYSEAQRQPGNAENHTESRKVGEKKSTSYEPLGRSGISGLVAPGHQITTARSHCKAKVWPWIFASGNPPPFSAIPNPGDSTWLHQNVDMNCFIFLGNLSYFFLIVSVCKCMHASV